MENSILNIIPELPVAEWIEAIVDWLTTNLAFLFDALKDGGDWLMEGMADLLMLIPPVLFILGLPSISSHRTGISSVETSQ